MRRTRQELHPPADNDNFSFFFLVFTLELVKSKFPLNCVYFLYLPYLFYLFIYIQSINLPTATTYLLWYTVQRLSIFLLIFLQTTRIYCHYYLIQIL